MPNRLHDNLIRNIPLQLLVRQADAVLYSHLIAHTAVLTQNRDALDLDPVLHDARRVAPDWRWCTLHSCPGADSAAPADDGVEHACVVLDFAVLQDDGLLHTGSCSNDSPGSNRDVGAELGGGMDLSGGVDEDRWDDVGARLRELIAARLPCALQVESIRGHSRPSRLDLSPEVLRLTNKELLTIRHITQDILFQTNDLILPLLIIIVVLASSHGMECFEIVGGRVRYETCGAVGAALDGRFDRGEDGFGREEVDAAVDQVGDLGFGLFDIMKHAAGVRVADNATKVGSSVVADPRPQNDSLSIPVVEQLEHIPQREAAADIRIQHKQPLGPTLEDRITEVIQSTSRTQSLVLAQVFDRSKGGELLGGVLDEVAEDGLVVVADDADVVDGADGSDGGEAVPDDGVTGDFEERFGNVEGERAEAGAATRAADLEMLVLGEGQKLEESAGHTRITALVVPSPLVRCVIGTWSDMMTRCVLRAALLSWLRLGS